MVDQGMNLPADHFFSLKPQHGQSGRIDERDQSVLPDAKDTFGSGF